MVKPARGEQGRGITVGRARRRRAGAGGRAARCSSAPTSWSRSWCDGDDLRVVVIDRQVVAAAVRRPAEIVGDGRHTVADAGRAPPAAAGSGPPAGSRGSRWTTITAEVVAEAGYAMDDVPAERASGSGSGGRRTCTPAARSRTSPTGCTRRSPTPRCAPPTALGIPVTGLDFLVPDVERPRLRLHRGQRAARAWPTTSRSRSSSGSSTCSSPRPAVADGTLPTRDLRARRARRRPGRAGALGRRRGAAALPRRLALGDAAGQPHRLPADRRPAGRAARPVPALPAGCGRSSPSACSAGSRRTPRSRWTSSG